MAENRKTLQRDDAPVVCEAFRVAEEERSSVQKFLQHASTYDYGEAASKDPSDTQPLPPPIVTSIETAKPVQLTAEERAENAKRLLTRPGRG